MKLYNSIAQLYKPTDNVKSFNSVKKTMKTINLIIPNMVTPYCLMAVVDSVMFAGGTVRNIVPTIAEVELDNHLSKEEVVVAIERAGYEVELAFE